MVPTRPAMPPKVSINPGQAQTQTDYDAYVSVTRSFQLPISFAAKAKPS